MIGKPKKLFVEIGGTLSDPEVKPIFVPLLQRLSESSEKPRIILLTETAYNGEYIKTKTIQDGVRMLQSYQLRPWLLVCRDTKDVAPCSYDERLEAERVISNKLYDATNFHLLRIISVPFYNNLGEYTQYIKHRFSPLLKQRFSNDIIIATSNTSKFADFQIYLANNYTIAMPAMQQKITIPEGMSSIEDNAIAKARAYAVRYNKVAIGDDTGFFIVALHGEPGVALRRWGGELPDNTTQEAFWSYLQEKTKNLNDLHAYFDQCIVVVAPNGNYCMIHNKNSGALNKDKLQLPYNGSDYPLAVAFESRDRPKTWDEMTEQEKATFDSDIINQLHSFLRDIIT